MINFVFCVIGYTVRQMQLALFRFNGNSAGAVFGFGDGMILPQTGHAFFSDHCIGDIVCQSKADATTETRFNEAVHRSGVKRILAVHELRQQADVSLLGTLLGHQIRQAFPGVQILGMDDPGSHHRGRQIARIFRTGFRTEYTVDPAVLVLRQTHIIDVGLIRIQIRQHNGLFPEAEVVDAVFAFCHGEKIFPVIALYPNHQTILAVQIDRSGIKHGIDTKTLQEKWICLRVQIIPPVQRHMIPGQHRIFPMHINAIAKRRFLVFVAEQLFLLFLLPQIFRMIHFDFLLLRCC